MAGACIQGNCTTLPTAAQLGVPSQSPPLREVTPGQCVLVVDRAILKVEGGAAWVHRMYVRILASPGGTSETAVQANTGALLWMTRVTIQGPGDATEDCTVCGMSASSEASVFADGAIL